jgi:hypothetical protein
VYDTELGRVTTRGGDREGPLSFQRSAVAHGVSAYLPVLSFGRVHLPVTFEWRGAH